MVASAARNRGGRTPIAPTSITTSVNFGVDTLHLPQSPLFGTDGIRGKVGDLLTAPLAMALGYWSAQVFLAEKHQSGPVIIGQDSRLSSDMLAQAIAAGLNSAGVDVWQLGLCPTPCVAYLAHKTEAIGGIMISASHNPPEDNGIKFFNQHGLKLNRHGRNGPPANLRQMCSAH